MWHKRCRLKVLNSTFLTKYFNSMPDIYIKLMFWKLKRCSFDMIITVGVAHVFSLLLASKLKGFLKNCAFHAINFICMDTGTCI